MRIVGSIFKWLGIGVYAACAVIIVMFLMPIGGWKALNVLTGSMRPTIQPGTLVLIHRVPLHGIKPGDIVTYQNPGNFKETITHRVTKIAKVGGVTTVTVKGDANPVPDKPFPGGLIVGRVAFIVPGAGHLTSWLHNPFGLAALVIIPGLLVIWTEIRNLRRVLAQPKTRPAKIASDDPPEPPLPPSRPNAAASPKATATPVRPRRGLDGMSRMSALGLVVTFAVTGSALAATSVGTVKLKHNSFTAVSGTNDHPQTIFDCLHDGWKKFGFKNLGQCVSFVVHNQHDEVFPPIPTPHPPIPSVPPIPTPPFHHDAVAPTPTPAASPTPTPANSPAPSASP